jgi:hypothetical protein
MQQFKGKGWVFSAQDLRKKKETRIYIFVKIQRTSNVGTPHHHHPQQMQMPPPNVKQIQTLQLIN